MKDVKFDSQDSRHWDFKTRRTQKTHNGCLVSWQRPTTDRLKERKKHSVVKLFPFFKVVDNLAAERRRLMRKQRKKRESKFHLRAGTQQQPEAVVSIRSRNEVWVKCEGGILSSILLSKFLGLHPPSFIKKRKFLFWRNDDQKCFCPVVLLTPHLFSAFLMFLLSSTADVFDSITTLFFSWFQT